MRKCIFITGTNACGKSSLAKALIKHYGGINRVFNQITYCNDGETALAGPYSVSSIYGGVDKVTNEKGFSCTSKLADVVETALSTNKKVICEGSFMGTFGMNLTDAMFKADTYLVVSLYATPQIIVQRLQQRSNGKNGKRNVEAILKKQTQSMISAKKWASIGVPVLQIDTSEITFEEEVRMVINAIES